MTKVPDEFDTFGLDMRSERIMASQMEAKHRLLDLQLIGDDGALQPNVADELEHLIGIADTPVLVFCAFERIAEAFARTMDQLNTRYALVTGSTPAKQKLELIQMFREREFDVLVGTATLATGTDGLDRMCNTMILLNDTDDGALRRQLVGRILPRGKNADYSKKKFWRIQPC
jgi:superfamily II DNA or RNA helicase